MSGKDEDNEPAVELAGEDLFHFAINRQDIKSLIALLPEEAACKPETVEYELQLLKIISTGWAISFFLENSPHRDRLAGIFWKAVYEFAENLSKTTRLMTGQDINYFRVLKERLDMYVRALSEKAGALEPAAVIGPEFSRVCGNAGDVFAVMTGSRMFIMTVASVKEYIGAAFSQ